MKERVRVYELARQMNIHNDDIITTLRELGYDIKSHSSTIDSVAVGLLIPALNKKKEQQAGKSKPAAKPAAGSKTTAKAPPPPPPVVKPRVLSRYRPVPVAVPGTEPVAEAAPAATPVASNETELPAPPHSEVSTAHSAAPPSATTAAPPAHATLAPQAPPAPVESKTVAELQPETFEPVEAEAPEAPAAPVTQEDQPSKGSQADNKNKQYIEEEIIAPESEDAGEKRGSSNSGQAVRPMTPSVPIRIAAPSIRATPPRPPKSHRPSPTARHGQRDRESTRPATAAVVEVPKVIALTTGLTVQDLAAKMQVTESEIIKRLFMRGIPRTLNQTVELELARELAQEMEYEVLSEELVPQVEPEEERILTAEEQAALVTRPPVVTIMGHVDHGKTSLLDAIRQTKFLLTDAEAGGITQHIGAYHVEVPHEDGTMRQIVFLDTPGHEAFTAMRARGAKATDIAILVVAADDGVMPQTIEAIDHAKAAGVPIIVAVNKVDKADSDPDRVLTQLMEHGLLPDKFGGETVTVNVSAKKKTGLDELLEMILLVSDMLDLKANPDTSAAGVIIEAELSRGKGPVATALVEAGTLREGDYIVAGSASGRVRALFDDRGQRVKAAGPSMPVEVLGLDAVPEAGDRFEVVADMQAVKVLVESRKTMTGTRAHHVTLESLHDMLQKGEMKDLNVIVKADVQGTAEAIAEQVKANRQRSSCAGLACSQR